MSFSVAQYQEVIARTNSELNELPPIANAAIQRIESRYSWIPFVGGWIKDALNKFVSLMEEFLAKVESYLRSSAVPVMMWEAGNTWENIQRGAGTMAGDIKGQLQASAVQWTGIAGGAYQSGVANQSGAVQEISGLAAATSGAATAIAISGLGFYVAILAALCLAGLRHRDRGERRRAGRGHRRRGHRRRHRGWPVLPRRGVPPADPPGPGRRQLRVPRRQVAPSHDLLLTPHAPDAARS